MTELEARQKAVEQFRSWLGWSESSGKHKKIIDIYNTQRPLPAGYKVTYKDAWCATAVSAVGVALGWTDIILPECSCNRMIALYQKAGRWQENDAYTPQIGDLMLYDWDDSGVGDNRGVADHIGMVSKVAGRTLKIIEGNYKNSVGYRTMAVNGKFIRGYCLPNYAAKATSTAKQPTTRLVSVKVQQLQNGCTGSSVRALQLLLNGLVGSKLNVDGEFGPKTASAVKQYQTANKTRCGSVDGICGQKTWASLLNET